MNGESRRELEDAPAGRETPARALRVVHLAEGGGWAGIETHLVNFMAGVRDRTDVEGVLAVLADGRLKEAVREQGGTVELVERKARMDPRTLLSVTRFLRRVAPDVIHMHGYLAILLGVPASLMAGVPVRVVTLHASPEPAVGEGLKLRMYLWLTYLVLKTFGVHSIAVSRDLLESHVTARGMSRDRLEVVHNGIDAEIRSGLPDRGRGDLGLEEDVFLVGMVGRVDENKGHLFLLEAIAELSPDVGPIHLVVVGEGPSRAGLEEYCRQEGMDDSVSFVGFRTDVLEYLACLDVLVIASLHEGIPYVLLEAMSLGVPVLSTAVGGIPEVVTDSESGLLVQRGSSEALAAGLRRLVDDEGLRSRLSREASRSVREKFSQERMVDATVGVYRRRLTARSG